MGPIQYSGPRAGQLAGPDPAPVEVYKQSVDGDGKFVDQPGGARNGWRGHATGDWGCPWASRASRFMGDGIVVNDSQSCRLGFYLLLTTGDDVDPATAAGAGYVRLAPKASDK
ncbi:hypothetical protein B0H14DRAFT_3143689 [Mycena olivaceomarginata]|nr:hypothetical protein B0H14DRAFT_3143689 [Mycena olivaceomarginata]